MFRVTAQRTRGSNGKPTWGGFDLSNMYADPAGDRIDYWEREVCYKATDTLENVLSSDKYLKFNLLANILVRDEKIKPKTEVELFATGAVKEIRVGKRKYRTYGNKYLGKR